MKLGPIEKFNPNNPDHLDSTKYKIVEYEQSGRKPTSVSFNVSLKDDMSRRDLTINAMAIDKDGNIIDHFDGKRDIKNKIIRTVGNPYDRFEEDKLRLARAGRFAGRMNFEIDPETKDAIKKNAHKVKDVAPERIRDELLKMAKESGDKFADTLLHLDEIGILEIILPEITKLKEFKETPHHHPEAYAFGDGTVYDHVLQAVRANKVKDPLVNLAILLHDVGKGVTYKQRDGKHTFYGHDMAAVELIETIAKRLKLTNDEKDAVLFAAINHMKLFKSGGMKPTKIVKIVHDKNWELLKAVSLADDSARLGLFDKKRFEETINSMEDIAKQWGGGTLGKVTKIVDGKRVMELTGLKPGKMIGDIINKVTELVMDDGAKEDIDKLIMKAWKELK